MPELQRARGHDSTRADQRRKPRRHRKCVAKSVDHGAGFDIDRHGGPNTAQVGVAVADDDVIVADVRVAYLDVVELERLHLDTPSDARYECNATSEVVTYTAPSDTTGSDTRVRAGVHRPGHLQCVDVVIGNRLLERIVSSTVGALPGHLPTAGEHDDQQRACSDATGSDPRRWTLPHRHRRLACARQTPVPQRRIQQSKQRSDGDCRQPPSRRQDSVGANAISRPSAVPTNNRPPVTAGAPVIDEPIAPCHRCEHVG